MLNKKIVLISTLLLSSVAFAESTVSEYELGTIANYDMNKNCTVAQIQKFEEANLLKRTSLSKDGKEMFSEKIASKVGFTHIYYKAIEDKTSEIGFVITEKNDANQDILETLFDCNGKIVSFQRIIE